MEAVTVDGMGVRCVQVLMRLRRAMAGAPSGTVFHVVTDDPAAELDLAAWCHMTGHGYLGAVASAARPTYAVRLADGGRATDPDRPWHRRHAG